MGKTTTKRFEIKTSRIDKDGKAPIRLIYQFAGDRKIIPTSFKVRPANWNKGAAVYLNKAAVKKKAPEIDYTCFLMESEVRALNSKLEALKREIEDIEQSFVIAKQDYKLFEVVERYQANLVGAIPENPKLFISDFIEKFVTENKGIIKERTLKTYSTIAKHLAAQKEKPTFENLDRSRLKSLHKYFIDEGMNNTTISKQFSILKALIREAIKNDKTIIAAQDFRDYSIKRNDSNYEVIALEQAEFSAILDLDLSDYSKKFELKPGVNLSFQSLDKVRDLFIFSCVTGLRYSDLADLKNEHIRDGAIYKKAQKTGQQLEIPLNPFSYFILNKYEGQLKPLPELSNQKCNEYLKILCKMAKINSRIEKTREYGTETKSEIFEKWQLISMHTGRKTFSTLSLEKGAASQDVMSLTGHKKYATFQRYMNISKKQKQKAMSVWGDLNKKDKVNVV